MRHIPPLTCCDYFICEKRKTRNITEGSRFGIAKLSAMCPGRSRCHYCEDGPLDAIEYLRPKDGRIPILWSLTEIVSPFHKGGQGDFDTSICQNGDCDSGRLDVWKWYVLYC